MFSAIKNFVIQGTQRSFGDEINRRIVVVNLFSAVGSFITFALGFRALFSQDFPLAGVLLTASVLFAVSQRIQLHHGAESHGMLGSVLLLSCLLLLMILLVISGGNMGTGPLWIFTVPPVTMFFAGFKRGLVVITFFVLLLSVILFTPGDAFLLTPYSFEFKSRLLYSFLTVSFLSAFYEFSRQRSYEKAMYLSEQFEHQALHDPLTQLLNRRGGQQQLENEFSRIQRNGKSFSIALADIDRFKKINDTFGHDLGDEVLKRVSELFSSRLRTQDSLSRWGGEEFLFIFPETNEENATIATNQIREHLSAFELPIAGRQHQVTSSFGICEITPLTTLTEALSNVDKALYKAKNSGRNKVYTASSLTCDQSDSD